MREITDSGMKSKPENLSRVLIDALEILEPLRTVPRFYEELEVLLKESSYARLRIGVVGVTSSGKSTFINGLLGESLLPEDSVATTNIPVICRRGTRRKLSVSYEGTEGGPPRVVDYYDDAVTADLVRGFCSEGCNPDNLKGIARVEVESSGCCLAPTLELIDTPGTDAEGLPGHEAITLYRCLPIADIIVFMTSIQRRIQQSEAKLLRNVIDHDQRVLFVMARSDAERDDIQNGEVILTKAQKLRNRESSMVATLSEFEKLQNCGIFAVSSVCAKEAQGNRLTEKWHESNFDSVLACFDEYARDLERLLASSRIQRTFAIIDSISKQIKAQTAQLAEEFGRNAAAAHQTANSSANAERQMRTDVNAIRESVLEAIDPAVLQLDAIAELAGVAETDLTRITDAMKRVGKRWKQITEMQQARIDSLREKLRGELAERKLQTGRSHLQQKVLNLGSLPDAGASTRRRTRSYEVTIPRTYWGGTLVDAIFGVRSETRYETTSYVDMKALKQDLSLFVTTSVEQFRVSADEQCNVMLDLYVLPVTREKEQDEERFQALADRMDVGEWLPQVSRQLKELHEKYFPAKQGLRNIVGRQSTAVTRDSAPDLEEEDRRKTVRRPLNAVIAKLWESIAIQRFIDAAKQAAGNNQLQEVLLLGPQESVCDLNLFLTRSLRRVAGDRVSSQSVTWDSYSIARPSGQIKISWFCGYSLSLDLIRAACQSADAIAMYFEAGQTSLGIKLLLEDACFQCLKDFPQKLFYVYGDGAVFDSRLADLVTQIAPLVAVKTRFGPRPWYIYESATYDARYSDFLEICMEQKRNGGSDRDFVRLWRQRQISTRNPFSVDALTSAFVATTIKERG